MIVKLMRTLFIVLLSCVSLRATGAEKPVFYFTALPNQDEAELNKKFGRLAKYLEEKLGVTVVYVPLHTYEAAVDAFIQNKIQMAWFGAYTGLQARHAVPNSEAIAQGAEDVSFKSYFIANASTGLKKSESFPKGIAGKSFVFGAPLSTSGRLIPEYLIRQNFKKAPDKVFSNVSFSGDHESTLDLVQWGLGNVGVLNYTVYEAAKKAGKVDETKVSVIWETPPFPDNSFVIRGDAEEKFGAGFKAKVRQVLLDLDDKEILKSFSRSKFIPATNEQYEFIEEVIGIIEHEEYAAAK